MPWIAPQTPLPRYETVPNPTKVHFIITTELLVESLGTWECQCCFITLATSNKYFTSCACFSVPGAREMWGDSPSLIPTFSGLISAFNFNTHTHSYCNFPNIKVTISLYYNCILQWKGFHLNEQNQAKWRTTIQSWNKLGLHVLKTQEQCEYGHSTYFSHYKNQEIRIKYYIFNLWSERTQFWIKAR